MALSTLGEKVLMSLRRNNVSERKVQKRQMDVPRADEVAQSREWEDL